MTAKPVPAETTTPPPVDGPQPWKWTREQYYKLDELGFFGGKRVELIRGEVVELSPINIAHATGVDMIADALAMMFAAGFTENTATILCTQRCPWFGTATRCGSNPRQTMKRSPYPGITDR